jgi:hypothetical protein
MQAKLLRDPISAVNAGSLLAFAPENRHHHTVREQTDYLLPTYGLRLHPEFLESDRVSSH